MFQAFKRMFCDRIMFFESIKKTFFRKRKKFFKLENGFSNLIK